MSILNFREEKRLKKMGFSTIAGIDEVGRGALAGPVVAASCAITNLERFLRHREAANIVVRIRDSKTLSPKQRLALYKEIFMLPFFEIAVRSVGPSQIDRINIKNATLKAMRNAAKALKIKPEILLIDGIDKIPGIAVPQRTYIKGDARIFLIAASSIVAKVSRDRLMERLDIRYPKWGFAIHKGYGTRLHKIRIKKFDISPIHRRSFL